jgi:hypothetical protein
VVFLLGENERLVRQEQVSDRQKMSLLLASHMASASATGNVVITHAESIKMEPVEDTNTCSISDVHLRYQRYK